MSTNNRDFKGVWISKEIWMSKDLSMIEKGILTEISSLDNEFHCVASNEYFAEFCQCSVSTVTRAISHLIELGYIEQIAFNGRSRVLKMTNQPSQIDEADSSFCSPINIINNKTNNTPKIDNSRVENFLNNFHTQCKSLSRVRNVTDKRKKAIIKILSKYSEEDIDTVFKKTEESNFLTGKNDRGWKADIDFILREDKFVSILEGKYDNKQGTKVKFGELGNVVSKSVTKEERENGFIEGQVY